MSISYHQNTHLLLAEHTLPQPGECEPHGSACSGRDSGVCSISRDGKEEANEAKRRGWGIFWKSSLCFGVFGHAVCVRGEEPKADTFSKLAIAGRGEPQPWRACSYVRDVTRGRGCVLTESRNLGSELLVGVGDERRCVWRLLIPGVCVCVCAFSSTPKKTHLFSAD